MKVFGTGISVETPNCTAATVGIISGNDHPGIHPGFAVRKSLTNIKKSRNGAKIKVLARGY